MRVISLFTEIIFLAGLLYVATAVDVDSTQDKCGQGNKTTKETLQCLSESLASWDMQLNHVYKELQKVLSKDGREDLKLSQLKWLAFRDAEVPFIDNSYSSLKGTIHKAYSMENNVALTKDRALQLKRYLAEINEAQGEI